MASIIKVDTIQDQDGNNIISEAANTITIGASGDTITIPSGATLANSGIVTGFQSTGIDDNATSTAITIDSSERVGILQTSPTSNLHVKSGGNTSVRFEGNLNSNLSTFLLSHTSSGDAGLQFNSNQLNMFSYGDIAFYPSTSNASGSYPNGEVMRIRNNGRVGIGTSSPAHNVEIVATASGSINDTLQIRNNSGDTGSGSRIRFITSNDSNSDANGASLGTVRNGNDNAMFFETENAERMRIDSSGSVGIGNTTMSSFNSEANNLVVGTGSGDEGITIYTGSSAGHHGSIFFADGTDVNAQKRGQIRYEHNTEIMSFFTNTLERMRINSSGNVGIGTTVTGTASTSPQLTISSTGEQLLLQGTTNGIGQSVDLIFEQKLTTNLTRNGGKISSVATGSYTAGDGGTYDSALVFYSGTDGVNTERMRITSAGQVAIGTTGSPNGSRFAIDNPNPNGTSEVGWGIDTNGGGYWAYTNQNTYWNNTSIGDAYINIRYKGNTVGSIKTGTTNVAYNTTSDYRLKNNISNVLNAVDRVKQLKPIRFSFIVEPDKIVDGFLAHEVQEVVPEAITGRRKIWQ
jgi:hypothetical protein